MPQSPIFGITLPVAFRRVRDGDTIVVALASPLEFPVRLRNVDCPELPTPEGRHAAAYVRQRLAKAKSLVLCLGLPDASNLFGGLSFDRVVGDLWVDGSNLAEELVRKGFARRA